MEYLFHQNLKKYYGKDPSQCTVDEIVGTWIALIAIPKTIFINLTSFLIWRALDIIKPFPARSSEKLSGGWGIMIDDVISGFYSLIIVHLNCLLIWSLLKNESLFNFNWG